MKGFSYLIREMSFFNGTCQWMGKEVQISLEVDIENKASWNYVRNAMKKLIEEPETWDKALQDFAVKQLTSLVNEWLKDNEETVWNPEKDPITEDEFGNHIILTEFSISPGRRFTAWYENDDMFWGQVVIVEVTLKKGPISADMQG